MTNSELKHPIHANPAFEKKKNCLEMKIDQLILTLSVWILQDTCQAASCNAAALSDVNGQDDHEDLYVLNVLARKKLKTMPQAKQEIAAHAEGRHKQNS